MAPLGEVVDAFAQGRPAVFVNELRDLGVVGVPVAAADTELVNFLVTECRGQLYVAVGRARLDALRIAPQPHTSTAPEHVHVPVDARTGVTTGISARDRMRTIHALVDADAQAEDFRQPGHVTPMALHPDGVLGRIGLAEALQDAANATGFGTGVAFCGLLTDDGHMAATGDLERFATRHGLPLARMADAIRHRRHTDLWAIPPRLQHELPYLALNARIRAHRAGDLRDTYPVAVVPVCVDGHVLGICSCPDPAPTRAAVDGGGGAIVATWPSTGVPMCSVPPMPFRAALSAVVAADLAGAAPARLEPMERPSP